jgi:hypothetical protein
MSRHLLAEQNISSVKLASLNMIILGIRKVIMTLTSPDPHYGRKKAP